MNKTEFIHLIQQPETLKNGQVAALKQVVNDFPYFTNAQVLLAKALHNEQHYEYDKYLKQTALTVPDREVLYYYIHQLDKPWTRELESIITEPTPLIEEAKIEVVFEETFTHEQPHEVVLIEEIEDVSIVEKATEKEIEELTPTFAEIEPSILTVEVQIEDAEVLQSADEIEADLAIEELLNEQQITVEVPTAVRAESNDAIQVIPETIEAPTEELIDENEEHSFLEWLNLKAGQPAEKTTEDKQDTSKPVVESEPHNKEEATELTEPNAVTSETNLSLPEVTKEDIEKAVAKSNVNDFHGILDKFIKENPSISRPKAEFFNPVNMAKQSVEEDEELVTETLANLYYKQGNLKKAIRAYEKLCLKYPSKITYFANLIQKIKTELKD